MALGSSTSQDLGDDCFGDRFSDLPDSVIHHIFSLLGMNDMAHISILSKRCRQVCFSSPYLYFDSYTDRHSTPNCRKFSSFLDKFMFQRGGGEIHSFHLHWSRHDNHANERSLLDSCIRQIAKCDVQELDFKLLSSGNKKEIYMIPNPAFACPSLRVLKLDLHRDTLILPSLILASLEVLSLNSVAYEGDLPLGEWISTYCPNLKKLSLVSIQNMTKKFEIINSSIEDLTISLANYESTSHVSISAENLRALSLNSPPSRFRDSFVRISAPNLQVLKWEGDPISRIDLGNFTSLSNATIYIPHKYSASESSLNCLVELLKGASSAKVLTLHISLIEILFTRDQMPLLFENLHHLNIKLGRLEDYHIPIIANFIKRLPNLTTVTIKHNNTSGYDSWDSTFMSLLKSKVSNYNREHRRSKSQALPHQVKEVEIDLGVESNAIKLVKYFLGNASGLEKMRVFYPYSSFYMLSTFPTETSKIASPRVAFICQVKELTK